MSEQFESHADRLQNFVSELVRPAVVGLLGERRLAYQVWPSVVAYDDDQQFVMEIDLLVVNVDTVIAVECKSKLSLADVDEHLERLAIFKRYFPLLAPYTLQGAVAAMVLPDALGRYACRKGLFVLAQSGDAVEIRNDAGFAPQTW